MAKPVSMAEPSGAACGLMGAASEVSSTPHPPQEVTNAGLDAVGIISSLGNPSTLLKCSKGLLEVPCHVWMSRAGKHAGLPQV